MAKDAIRGLGANKTERAIERVGKAIGTLAPLLESFDQKINVKEVSGSHRRASMKKDIEEVVNELTIHAVFSTIHGRKHPTFPSPRDLLHGKPSTELQGWMHDKETGKNCSNEVITFF